MLQKGTNSFVLKYTFKGICRHESKQEVTKGKQLVTMANRKTRNLPPPPPPPPLDRNDEISSKCFKSRKEFDGGYTDLKIYSCVEEL